MHQWTLDKLYELGQFVAALQQEIRDLKDRLDRAERKADQNRAARPATWQLVLGAIGVICAVGSLVVSIVALRH